MRHFDFGIADFGALPMHFFLPSCLEHRVVTLPMLIRVCSKMSDYQRPRLSYVCGQTGHLAAYHDTGACEQGTFGALPSGFSGQVIHHAAPVYCGGGRRGRRGRGASLICLALHFFLFYYTLRVPPFPCCVPALQCVTAYRLYSYSGALTVAGGGVAAGPQPRPQLISSYERHLTH